MNFRVIALASCVALASIAFGGKAQAQTATVGGGGTVSPFCTVTNTPSTGVMKLATSGKTLSSSGPTGAVPSSFTLTCNNTATFTVATSSSGTASVPTGAVYTAQLLDGTTSLTTSTGAATSAASSPIVAINFVDKSISMIHTLTHATTNLPTGDYAFTSTVSITPQ